MSRYCICRSLDSSGFMIQCDRCEEWFHGRCIGLKRKCADNIEKYYCVDCRKNHNLKIIFEDTNVAEQEQSLVAGEKSAPVVKQEPLEERKQERDIQEAASAPKQVPKPIVATKSPRKQATSRRKLGQKTKSKAVQCGNPDCTKAARQEMSSKYCSDECGYAFNKLRFEKIYRRKWTNISPKNHSAVIYTKMDDSLAAKDEIRELQELIENLRAEKKETEANVQIIKKEAQEMYRRQKIVEDTDESSTKNEDTEEILSADSTRTFCITCGISIARTQTFKHWQSCHRKHEDTFSVMGIAASSTEGNDDLKIFCDFEDKKHKTFCKYYASACPFHKMTQSIKGEVCGCPLTTMQKLVPDGNYCLELKKDCTMHYHWDKFRLAEFDMLLLQAYNKLDASHSRKISSDIQMSDTYGGVVGFMLHNTIDHVVKETEEKPKVIPNETQVENIMIDI